ncbi:pirin family protein [Vibrio sonorensis]|uniref:pirin family protein n=1 Tax=Vibrio sonorensis TaxID=1004316 RepID=UPI0008DA00B2|nr:pirin family protein [Vibrio sonorensis]
MMNVKQIFQTIPMHDTSDGDGVKIRRVTGFNNASFSPFLMVDELKSDNQADYVGGFPPHPHRGIETLTYMINGHFEHKDHMGNVGQLKSGGAQWMASGRGVIHSEMPIMQDGQLHGFQIWINQPAKNKMAPAQYFDFQNESITEIANPELGLLRILAGEVQLGAKSEFGPLTQTGVPLSVSDWRSNPNQSIELTLNQAHNTMILVYKGEVTIAGKSLGQGNLALLDKEAVLSIKAVSDSGVLIFTGQPIDEPVVHYGPFVMNSIEEIEQAIHDYNNGTLISDN